ncbi:MAG: response regulator [bacterium]
MKKIILVVEDDKALSEEISVNLGQAGFSVLVAVSVDEALAQMEKAPAIQAVWLDHNLIGNLTGLDFLGELKINSKWKEIPVFVVTNTMDDDKIAEYQLLGIEKYFVKSTNTLANIVEDIKKTV